MTKKVENKENGAEQFNIFAESLGIKNDVSDESQDEEVSDDDSSEEVSEIVFEEGMTRYDSEGNEDEEGEYGENGAKYVFEESGDDETTEEESASEEEDNSEKKDDAYDADGDVTEADVASLMAETFAEKTGIEIEEGKKFNSVEDFVDLIRDVIDANSEPRYASDRVKEIDEYVKNGGKLEDYFKGEEKIFSLENIDITKEEDQKRVIRKFYEDKGLSEKRIDRIIDGLDDDELEDESKELHERLLEKAKNEQETSKKTQEEAKRKALEAQEKFVSDYKSFVNKFDSFNGVKLTDSDRKLVIDYVLGVDRNTGKSKSQMDYDENPFEVLAQLALIRTKKDLAVSLKKSAETDATKKFREKLKRNSSKEKLKSDKTSVKESAAIDIIKKEVRKLKMA